MTVGVLATGHQVRCILWVQVAIFNNGIGFYVDENSLHWIYFVKNTYNQIYVWCCEYAKKNCQRGANTLLWASKHTSMFIYCVLEQWLHPASTGKLKVVSSNNIHYTSRLSSGHPIVSVHNGHFLSCISVTGPSFKPNNFFWPNLTYFKLPCM